MNRSQRSSPVAPAGDDKTTWTAALEQGANVLQDVTPLKGFDVYVCGFHPARDDPQMQMEAHHYCRVVNDDFIQCVLFDGNTRKANLIGVEYIVSERLFGSLPTHERQYWHPHNFEVLSGTLIAPGLPAVAEQALMRHLLNGYGKTWHTWHTGRHDIGGGDSIPLGEPMLMWSFNRDGELDPALEHNRETSMGLDTPATRDRRQRLTDLTHPQHGVDTLKDEFSDTSPVAGVMDVNTQDGGGD